MVTGVGIDLIEVERVATKIGKENGFRELVFTPKEISYCESKKNKFEHYAARFAAKEAFFKACGTGWKDGTSFNEVEITNDDNGKPVLLLLGNTAIIMAEAGITKCLVSLSHLKSLASAVVVIEN